ncbi:MAG TPA: ABC transporter ATP-binding protein [Anaerolineales bacterium]|nr:ABC transporter ATP-binding protein [Anaerolineales bacterium]
MGFFGSLGAESYDRQYSDAQLLRRMGDYFAPHRRAIVIVSATLLATALFDTVPSLLIAYGVGLAEDGAPFNLLLLVAGGLLLNNVIYWLTNYVRRRVTTQLIGDLIRALREDAFRAAIGHDLSFYDRISTGRIVSRITFDTQEFANVAMLVADTLSQLISVAILSVALLRADVGLTLMLALATLPVFFAAGAFRRLARHVTRQGTRAMANVNASIQETVSGISVAKNFRQESLVYDEFRETNGESYRINLRRGLVLASVFPVLHLFSGLAAGLLTYYGGLAVLGGAISAGVWYLFIQSVERFFFPFLNLASFWPQVQAGLSAAERVFGLIDTEPVVQQTGSTWPERLRGAVAFEGVRFQYSDKEVVLPDFSLDIRPGETLALVGHTGAGKSSIGRLIARFYEFQGGRILIDGHDIRDFDLHAYRRHLGIVSQVPFLFEDTVANNIRYGKPELSDAEIEALCKKVGHGDWLEGLPEGIQTHVGQRGGRLSLGQRQLVALMRVLAQQPAIFILDEATASIDPFTESQIQEALDLILEHSTAIVIAHRLSTVRAADRIIVLQKGAIIEEGSHDQLLERGGHYAELYNTYFRHQSLEFIESAAALKGRLKDGG